MKTNKLIIILLMIPVLALATWVGAIEYQYKSAPKVLIAATGYDPRDLLSGHYLNLRLLWDKTDCTQFEDKVCPEDRFNYRYRFYLGEDDAVYLDRIFARNDLDIKLEFLMHASAEPLLKQLYIENMPWDQWVKLETQREQIR